ncbi:hypothetical protein, partial [Klebsiella pneumoniae]|uniref:hypothetical protein n=1 Tax=Klebsiella pneumoniae TaxID=573 RepID=UPI0027315F18
DARKDGQRGDALVVLHTKAMGEPVEMTALGTSVPARKARGAIVEKGEDACKVIGDYLSNHLNATSNCGSWTSVGAGLPAKAAA